MKNTLNGWLQIVEEAAPLPVPVKFTLAQMDPVYGELEETIRVVSTVEVPATHDKEALSKAIEGFLLDTTEGHPSSQPAQEALAFRMAVPAVLLDVEGLPYLLDRFPSLLTKTVPVDRLSQWHAEKNFESTLYGLAFRYSLSSPMDALAKSILSGNNPEADFALGSLLPKAPNKVVRLWDLPNSLQPTFLPNVLELAISHQRQHPTHGRWEEKQLMEMAINALVRDVAFPFRVCMPAFEASGLFKNNAKEAFPIAAIHGHAGVLKSLEGKAPWRDLRMGRLDSVFQTAMIGLDDPTRLHTKPEVYEDALLEIARQASKEGKIGKFLKNIELDTRQGKRAEPLSSVVEFSLNRLLVVFLEQGLDPTAPVLPGVPSAMDMARMYNNLEALDIMASHGARKKIQSLLEQMPIENPQGNRLSP